MTDNDVRRELARARLQARQNRSGGTVNAGRSLYSAYDDSFGALGRSPRSSEDFEPGGQCAVKGNRSDGSARAKRVSAPRVVEKSASRKINASMVGNVRQSPRNTKSHNIIVGCDSRAGWSASAYQSEKRGVKAIPGRMVSLFRDFTGLLATGLSSVFSALARLPFSGVLLPVALVLVIGFAGFKLVPHVLGDYGSSGADVTGVVSEDGASPELDVLVSLLGEDKGTWLYVSSRFDGDCFWIASHPEAYAEFGEDLQVTLLTLAADERGSSGFVRGMAESYPAESAAEYNGCGDGSLAGYPILYQWDERWGCLPYGSGPIGLSGCEPATLSIVYQGLTGKTDMPPNAMAAFASSSGYVANSGESSVSLVVNGGADLGLAPAEIGLAKDNLVWTLESGVPVIACVEAGDFSEGEHYVALVGLDSDGKVLLIDPYSSMNTSKSWDADALVSQSKSLVAFYA